MEEIRMKDILLCISGFISIVVAILGSIGIEAGFIISLILLVLKLLKLCAIGWTVVVAPTLIPLIMLIVGILLMSVITVMLKD
jgi:hypothetical protein